MTDNQIQRCKARYAETVETAKRNMPPDVALQMKMFDSIVTSSYLKPTKKTKIKRQKGHIYAVKLDGCIKIGFSSDWRKRIKAYEISSLRVEVLFIKSAFQTQEMSFHKQYNNGSEKYNLDQENILKDLINAHLKST